MHKPEFVLDNEYLDLSRELKKLCNIVTVIPTVNRALGTIPKGLERGREELEIGGLIEMTQTTA